jgi:hypothetical protein
MPCDEQGTPAHFVLDQKTNCSSRPAFSRAQSGVCDEGTHLCLRTFTVVQRTPSPTPAPPGPQSQLEQLAERPSRPVRAAVRATPPSSPQTTNEGGMGCAGHFLGLWGSIVGSSPCLADACIPGGCTVRCATRPLPGPPISCCGSEAGATPQRPPCPAPNGSAVISLPPPLPLRSCSG